MTTLGTALTPNAIKVMMLGSGELGKEVVIELQRLGVEVIAVDRYENAPAQQVAHRAYTISMLDGAALKTLVEKERPDYIVPEVEAIATDTLIELEKAGFNVVPTAKATKLTMKAFAVWLPKSLAYQPHLINLSITLRTSKVRLKKSVFLAW